MKIKFLLLTAACIGMIACSKEDAEGPGTSDAGSKQIVLKLNLPVSTRVFTPDAPYEQDNTTIQTLDVYFTNANSTIQQAYRLTGTDFDNITKKESNGLRFTDLNNVSEVYIVANDNLDGNAPSLAVGKRMDTDFVTLLRNQGPELEQNAMIFAGSDVDITPVELDTNSPKVDDFTGNEKPWAQNDQVYTANITIRPLVSRMEWRDITIEHEGGKYISVVNEDKTYHYWVEWKNWNPTLAGIYQSNVYLGEKIFAARGAQNPDETYLFATPSNSSAISAGAWVKPATPNIGESIWPLINKTLAHSGAYTAGAEGAPGSYDDLIEDLTAYNAGDYCVPFHFFVPFTASLQNDTDPNFSTLNNTPEWHFQFYYPDTNNGSAEKDKQFTVTVYEANDDHNGPKGEAIDLSTDNVALSVAGEFYYPSRTDHLAYANVVKLYDANAVEGTDKVVVYRPGKIYFSNITISPYNVTPGFKDVTDYNVIVKVDVADFATVEVKPGFDKE